MMRKICEYEVLRYLGYPAGQEADEITKERIRRCSKELLKAVRPKSIYSCFSVHFESDSVLIDHSDCKLLGKSIYQHLFGASSCVIMAATLGVEADRAIKRAQLLSVADGLVMDACATALIEAVCDEQEEEINQRYGVCNARFSPGYGDFPLTQQKEILSLLEAEKRIGLCASEAHLLIPRKSVTAVMALGKEEKRAENKCTVCANKERCAFSRHES